MRILCITAAITIAFTIGYLSDLGASTGVVMMALGANGVAIGLGWLLLNRIKRGDNYLD